MNTSTTQSPDSLGSPPGYPSLWESLIMADDGNAVEAHPQDAAELADLHKRKLVSGKKWVSLTSYGKKVRDAVLLG